MFASPPNSLCSPSMN